MILYVLVYWLSVFHNIPLPAQHPDRKHTHFMQLHVTKIIAIKNVSNFIKNVYPFKTVTKSEWKRINYNTKWSLRKHATSLRSWSADQRFLSRAHGRCKKFLPLSLNHLLATETRRKRKYYIIPYAAVIKKNCGNICMLIEIVIMSDQLDVAKLLFTKSMPYRKYPSESH